MTQIVEGIEPTKDQVRALLKLPKTKPVTMVNLLKFKPDGGLESYKKYAEMLQPVLDRLGAKPVWLGKTKSLVVGEDRDEWDAVLIVTYPSPRAFLGMSSSQEYRELHEHREAALEKTVLIATETTADL